MDRQREKTIGQRLDGLATGSGLYAMTMIDRPEPRSRRVLPVVILLAMLAGYALNAVAMSAPGGWSPENRVALGIGGPVLFFAGFMAANFVRFFGPRLIPDPANPLDERELMLKARAGSISGTIVTILAIGACFYAAYAQVFGWWTPRHMADWTYLGLLIEGSAFTLPVLVASWLQGADPQAE